MSLEQTIVTALPTELLRSELLRRSADEGAQPVPLSVLVELLIGRLQSGGVLHSVHVKELLVALRQQSVKDLAEYAQANLLHLVEDDVLWAAISSSGQEKYGRSGTPSVREQVTHLLQEEDTREEFLDVVRKDVLEYLEDNELLDAINHIESAIDHLDDSLLWDAISTEGQKKLRGPVVEDLRTELGDMQVKINRMFDSVISTLEEW